MEPELNSDKKRVERIKILIMDTVKSKVEGAGAVHRWELIRNLAKIGHDVYVIAYKEVELDGVHTNILQTKKGVFDKLISRCLYVRMLFTLAKKHHVDILYTRNGLTGAIGYLLGIITGSNLVYELNGISSEEWKTIKKETKPNIFKRIEMALLIRIELFSLKKAEAVIAVTDGIKNYLVNQGISESKITVIGNGANTELFRPIDNSVTLQRLRKKYNIKEGEHVVTFVGNLAPWQGIEYLIKAAPLILENIPKTKFLIVGDGILREKLGSLVKELNIEYNIIFTRMVSYENVPEYISISDVCVAPFIRTRNENIGLAPLKLYEYLACAKPVVASNIKGVGDLLEVSKSGVSVTPDDPNELAKAITKLLKDEPLREQMGSNGRKNVIENCSWENTARKTKEVFEHMLIEGGCYR